MSKKIKAIENTVKAWESLPGNKNYTPKEIGAWLQGKMKPAIDNLREVLKEHKKK